MQYDATGASLPDLFRSLNVDPEEKEALIRLAESVRRLEHEREYQAMLFGEPPPPPPPPAPRRRTPPEKRWLHVVHTLGLPLAWAGATLLRRPAARRVLAGAVVATVGTAGALTPDLMQAAPASQVPHHIGAYHREVHRHHPAPGTTQQPVAPARRKRRRSDNDRTVRPSASPSAAAPGPSPTAPDPAPSPLPSVTVPPVPTPVPTCTILHGNHCHGGGVVGDAVKVLQGLPAYHDLS